MTENVEDTVVASMPDGTEAGAKDDAPEPDKDVWGRAFDPELHLTDDEGKPLYTKAGKLRVVRGKGLKKSVVASKEIKADVMFRQTGQATAQMVFVASIALGGPEWKPTDDENVYMSHAWAEYFKAKGIKDLPPGFILAAAFISYAIPRLGQPETQSRLKKAGKWVGRKFRKRKPDED